jgi:hypothetical protein
VRRSQAGRKSLANSKYLEMQTQTPYTSLASAICKYLQMRDRKSL